MITQGERQNFKWRPNDNSSTTRLRYDLEVEHWLKAIRSAELNNKTALFGESLSFIGLLVSLVFSLLILVVVSLNDIVKWIKAKTH